MYARKRTPQRPRKAYLKSFPAPVAGWIANRLLANPGGAPQGAAILDNFFPTPTSILQRRGKELHATLGNGDDTTRSMFSYVVGNNRKLFAAIDSTIYDITSIEFPDNVLLGTESGDVLGTGDGDELGWSSTENAEVYEGALGGEWIAVQMATTGSIFLVGVNGASTGFVYDGTEFWPYSAGGVWSLPYDNEVDAFTVGEIVTGSTSGATGTVYRVEADRLILIDVEDGPFQDGETLTGSLGGEADAAAEETDIVPGITFGTTDLTTADMAYVWVYQRRLFFAQKDSLSFWYLDLDAVGGAATEYPMGGEFTRGGSIFFGYAWSLDSGASGGLSDQCAIVSTEGQVVVFQGRNPSDANDWAKVNEYRIGRPLGRKAFVKAGGDLIVDTSVGAVPLSAAIARDFAALPTGAVSFPIEDAWTGAVQQRGMVGWCSEIWPENNMMLVSPPSVAGSTEPVLFIVNLSTGAWARYTNWHATCMHVFEGRLYFGSPDGRVFIGNTSGADAGQPYTSIYLPLFEDLGSPASLKVGQLARAVMRSRVELEARIDFQTDFNMSLEPAPDAIPITTGSQWGVGVWGVSIWNEPAKTFVEQDWVSVGGLGYMASLALQMTSGAIVPLDAEIIRLDLTYTVGDIGP